MPPRSERVEVRISDDVVRTRQVARSLAVETGLSLVDQTKIVTAASELARNMLDYGGGGQVSLAIVENGTRRGLREPWRAGGFVRQWPPPACSTYRISISAARMRRRWRGSPIVCATSGPMR